MKRNILITGTNRGLGKSLVQTLETNNLYNVFSLSRTGEISSRTINHFKIDLRHPETIRTLLDNTLYFDVLINNAGVYLDDPRKDVTKDINTIELNTILETYNVNFLSSFELVRVFYEQFLSNNRTFGRIINISSGMGRLSELNDKSFAYSSSKLLLNSVTIAYSKIFSTMCEDIGIASVCPGWVRTDMGTAQGVITPDKAADYIVSTINLSKKDFNGKFLRYGENLKWSEK